MRAPKRVQMTRNKPWRADNPDAVIVDRRSKWGNPFKVLDYLDVYDDSYDRARGVVVDAFRDWLNGNPWAAGSSPDWEERRQAILGSLSDLSGKDLACWCPLEDQHGKPVPCHADVLLELANEDGDT